MDDLPPEVLAHIIACLRPPDPALLRLRAVGRKWWRAVPLEQIIGIKKETARWLLGGNVVEWDAEMNSSVVRVKHDELPMEIEVDGFDIMMQYNPCGCVLDVGECRYLFKKYNGDMEILLKEGMRYETVAVCKFPVSQTDVHCCQFGTTIFF